MILENVVLDMPGWAITLISIAVSALVSGVVGFLIKRHLDRFFSKRDAEESKRITELNELERLRDEQDSKKLVDTIGKMIDDKVNPISKKLNAIGDGTLSSLRNDILTCYYRCVEKGFRNDWDYTNIHDLYESYAELDGNSFVADVMKRFDELQTREQFEKAKKKKKQALREKK